MDRRRRLGIAVGLLLVAAAAAATFRQAALRGERARFSYDPARTYYVDRVIDGDTLRLRSGHRVRLLGVDTPETVHPRLGEQLFGREASAFTRDTAEGRDVRLEFDREREDRYGRVLAWVFVDDRNLNVELVRHGFSQAVLISPLRSDYRKALVAAEAAAREQGLGIFSGGSK